MKWKKFFFEKKSSSFAVDLDSWVAGSCSNTALIAFVTAHLDVTIVTPASSPAKRNFNMNLIVDMREKTLPVFDEPVIFATVSTITYSEDTVVETSL